MRHGGVTDGRELEVDAMDLVDLLRSRCDHVELLQRPKQAGLDREARPEQRDAREATVVQAPRDHLEHVDDR